MDTEKSIFSEYCTQKQTIIPGLYYHINWAILKIRDHTANNEHLGKNRLSNELNHFNNFQLNDENTQNNKSNYPEL
jgi:hypothetical protein